MFVMFARYFKKQRTDDVIKQNILQIINFTKCSL